MKAIFQYSPKRLLPFLRPALINKKFLGNLSSSAQKNSQRPGFALVFTLSIILLLVVLVTGLLLFVRAQQSVAQPMIDKLRAEANARLSASLALGQMQKMLGSDLRATAPAQMQAVARGEGVIADGIATLNENRRFVPAVFATTYQYNGIDYPIVGRLDDNNEGPYPFQTGLTDRRYSYFGYYNEADYESNFNVTQWNWMVNALDDSTDFSAQARPSLLVGYLGSGIDFDPTAESSEKSISLANYRSLDPLSPETTLSSEIEVNLIDQEELRREQLSTGGFKNAQANFTGSFGFLIQDQSMLASLRPSAQENTTVMNYTENDWDWAQKLLSQNVSLSVNKNLPADADALWKGLSQNTLISYQDAVVLGVGSSSDWIDAKSAYSVIPNRRVFSSARLGSLQGDLSSYLSASDESLTSEDFLDARVRKRDAGNAAELEDEQQIAPIIPGKFFDEFNPSFEILRRYARLYDLVDEGEMDDYYYNQLLNTDNLVGNWASSYQSPFPSQQGSSVGSASDPGGEFVQRLHPIMTESSLWHVPTREDTTEGDLIYTHLHPKVTLWNPYSVDLPERAYLVAMPIKFRFSDNPEDFSDDAEPFQMRFKFRGDIESTAADGSTSTESVEVTAYLAADELIPTNRVGQGELTDMDGDGQDFIHRDYAVFYLEPTEIKAGEALVFTANPTAGAAAGAVTGPVEAGSPVSALYDRSNVLNNVLSASKVPDGSAYYVPAGVAFDSAEKQEYFQDSDGNPIDSKELYIFDVDAQGDTTTTLSRKSTDIMLFALLDNGVSSMAEGDVFTPNLTATNHPLVQRTCASLAGSGEHWTNRVGASYRSLRGYNYISTDYDGVGNRHLGSYQDMGGNSPPSRWGVTARIRYMDDRDSYEDNFGQDGNTVTDYFQRQPFIAQFNMRPIAQFHGMADHILAASHNSHTIGQLIFPRENADMFSNTLDGNYKINDRDLVSGSPFMLDRLGADEAREYVYFDVPSEGWNALSLIQFRHADWNNLAWISSYPLGHGMANYRASMDSTVHSHVTEVNPRWPWAPGPKNGTLIGNETVGMPFESASKVREMEFQDLVEYGSWSGSKTDFEEDLSSDHTADIMTYDFAYKLNHYLLDDFFLSTLSYDESNSLDWDWESSALNSRIVPAKLSSEEQAQIAASGYGLAASGLYLEGAFNLNSTNIHAWAAFLASLRGQTRETIEGEIAGDGEGTLFARTMKPLYPDAQRTLDYFDPAAHSGAYLLTDEEIYVLAEKIVEVNLERGPVLTVSDFVSRPLINQAMEQEQIVRTTQSKTSNSWSLATRIEDVPVARRSRLEEAILRAELNDGLMQDEALNDLPPRVDRIQPREFSANGDAIRGRDGFRRFASETPQEFRQKLSEADLLDEWVTWGLAGWITQQDILEPLLPAMTTRGDTFIIRSFGSSEESGEGARRYLEITVQRIPEFLHHEDREVEELSFGNRPQDKVVVENQQTAAISNNSELSDINKRFGRRFKVVSQRWVTENDL